MKIGVFLVILAMIYQFFDNLLNFVILIGACGCFTIFMYFLTNLLNSLLKNHFYKQYILEQVIRNSIAIFMIFFTIIYLYLIMKNIADNGFTDAKNYKNLLSIFIIIGTCFLNISLNRKFWISNNSQILKLKINNKEKLILSILSLVSVVSLISPGIIFGILALHFLHQIYKTGIKEFYIFAIINLIVSLLIFYFTIIRLLIYN